MDSITPAKKLSALKAYLKKMNSVAIAFSSGVDSTFLLKVAHDVLGDQVVAVTARSCSFPVRELKEAETFCQKEGIRHVIVDSEELAIDFEYVLGGCQDTKLLNVRLFDKPTMRKVYQEQTDKAKAEGISNCPYCAIGHDANRRRIWKMEEMDADHVTAWSKGGSTDIANCQMLCKTHNRAKGNR